MRKKEREQLVETLKTHGERRGAMKCIKNVCYDEKSDRIVVEFGRGCPDEYVQDVVKHALNGSEVHFTRAKRTPREP